MTKTSEPDFRSRRKFETDLESNIRTNYLNGLAEGRCEGLEEGLARGKAEGKTEMIKKMLINGVGAKEIQMFSDLSIGEIEKIKAQL